MSGLSQSTYIFTCIHTHSYTHVFNEYYSCMHTLCDEVLTACAHVRNDYVRVCVHSCMLVTSPLHVGA